MNEIQVDFFKEILIDLQAEIEAELQAGRESTKTVELDQARIGRLSRMDELQSQAIALEADRRRKLKLQKIQVALKRIENNEYGFCVSCDEIINHKRLEVDPTSIVCIDCAGGGVLND
ncbi:MAG: TraR/DksA family transcriptional regulator [Candidatus Dadabacteria bacterium]|nr:TraR/DksA family transcriptional regulator [Candidatus Dadabacteria bacterium]NIQ13677.1 TraR/DksA family transcriptional regulator [Candidatus Dadabacteria bacterium]